MLNGQLDLKLNGTQNSQPETEKRIPRPSNAFMIFGQQNRKLLANQFPQYTNKQISKILGDEWRKMKLDDKAHFHRLAEEAYAKHMEKYPGTMFAHTQSSSFSAFLLLIDSYLQVTTTVHSRPDNVKRIVKRSSFKKLIQNVPM